MAHPRGFIRDGAGQIVPPGAVKHELLASFLLGINPSWLTCPAGSQTYSNGTASRGYTRVTTGATTGNQAQLSVTGLNLNNMAAVLFELDGLSFDVASGTFDVVIGINAAGQVGGYASQASGSNTFTISSGNTATLAATATNFNIRTFGEGARRHNVGLMVIPPEKEVLLFSDRQVVGYRDSASTWNSAAATPQITLTTQEDGAHYFEVMALRVTAWAN